jgi:hypothetical protein
MKLDKILHLENISTYEHLADSLEEVMNHVPCIVRTDDTVFGYTRLLKKIVKALRRQCDIINHFKKYHIERDKLYKRTRS